MKIKLISFAVISFMLCLGSISYALEIKERKSGIKFSTEDDIAEGLYKITDKESGIVAYILKEPGGKITIETMPI